MSVRDGILGRFRGDRSGNAAVEFAILLPILLMLLLGTIDLGLGFQEKVKLQSALNSGMQHAMQTQGANVDVTRQVISYGLNSAATVEIEALCRCSGQASSCGSSCSPGMNCFVAASVSMPYRTMLFEMEMELAANFEIYVGRQP